MCGCPKVEYNTYPRMSKRAGMILLFWLDFKFRGVPPSVFYLTPVSSLHKTSTSMKIKFSDHAQQTQTFEGVTELEILISTVLFQLPIFMMVFFTSKMSSCLMQGACIGLFGEINPPSAPWEMWLCSHVDFTPQLVQLYWKSYSPFKLLWYKTHR